MGDKKSMFDGIHFGDVYFTFGGDRLIFHCHTYQNDMMLMQFVSEFNTDSIWIDDKGKCVNMPSYSSPLGNYYDIVSPLKETER